MVDSLTTQVEMGADPMMRSVSIAAFVAVRQFRDFLRSKTLRLGAKIATSAIPSPAEPCMASSAGATDRFFIPGYNTKLITDEYRKLYFPDDVQNLEPILQTISAAAASASNERICIEIMKYTTSSMALGAPEKMESASVTLANQLSSCGGYSLVFCELARLAGLPARYIGFFGIPETGSHALAEVYFDDSWHLFDPTFGVFCYSRESYDGLGHILSAEEIVTQPTRPTLMQVVETPWELNYEQQRVFPVQPLLDPPTSHVLTYWGERGRKIIFPVAFGNDSTISIPVRIDLLKESLFELGEATGKWLDTWLQCIDDPQNGYFFLGGTCPRIYHFVQIRAPTHSKIEVRYVSTSESTGTLEVFPLAGCFLVSKIVDDRSTSFVLATNNERPSFLLMSNLPYWIDTVRYSLSSPN